MNLESERLISQTVVKSRISHEATPYAAMENCDTFPCIASNPFL